MKYVDGYVIPLKKKNLKAYRKLAKLGCKIWTEHGALDYYECVGEDLKATWGLGFQRMCKLKADETVIFAFVVYKSKADRTRVNKAVMKDPRMSQDSNFQMPFDMKRFAMGGFKVLVEAK